MPPAKILPFKRPDRPSPHHRPLADVQPDARARCRDIGTSALLVAASCTTWMLTGTLLYGLFTGLACWQVWDAVFFWRRQRKLAERIAELERHFAEDQDDPR